MPKNKAFTLLELLITIGIFAIITVIAIPAYIQWIPNYKLSRDIFNLKADLEMAKLTAKRENTNIRVEFNNTQTSGEYRIFRMNDGSLIKYQELSPGDFYDFSIPFVFRPNGETVGAMAPPFPIELRGYGKTRAIRRIEVGLLGRIVIIK